MQSLQVRILFALGCLTAAAAGRLGAPRDLGLVAFFNSASGESFRFNITSAEDNSTSVVVIPWPTAAPTSQSNSFGRFWYRGIVGTLSTVAVFAVVALAILAAYVVAIFYLRGVIERGPPKPKDIPKDAGHDNCGDDDDDDDESLSDRTADTVDTAASSFWSDYGIKFSRFSKLWKRSSKKKQEEDETSPQSQYERHMASMHLVADTYQLAFEWRKALLKKINWLMLALLLIAIVLLGFPVGYATAAVCLVHVLLLLDLKFSPMMATALAFVYCVFLLLIAMFCGSSVLGIVAPFTYLPFWLYVRYSSIGQQNKANSQKFEKQATFLGLVREIASQVQMGSSSDEVATPVNGHYVSPTRICSVGNEEVTHLQFTPCQSPAGVAGWWIRGTCTTDEDVKQNIQKGMKNCPQFFVREGFLAITGEAYWVMQHRTEEVNCTVFHGKYDSGEGYFVAESKSLCGTRQPLFRLTQVSKTDSKKHYWITCDGCASVPIHGTRYAAKSRDYDLCQTCMDKYDEMENTTDELPPRDDFVAVVKPLQNPHSPNLQERERKLSG
ncbi:expressed unknown protein [Seminavis robusta]|uniref:ZZ-type domain-containing protein n=1 Tax=Seminavis robusta TaxID=568900 RepID=A0A9N8ECB1_9STRA|nr:expressed unknown protein [Seminavis robusta]|eukprot:Sro880_g215090.1 n/a (554) ;mRNA; r:31348-33009